MENSRNVKAHMYATQKGHDDDDRTMNKDAVEEEWAVDGKWKYHKIIENFP